MLRTFHITNSSSVFSISSRNSNCIDCETISLVMFRKLWQNEPSYHKLAMSLVKTLAGRIEAELQGEWNKITTYKGMKVINEVAKQRDFILENHQNFAETLAPLFKYLETGLLDEDALLESLNSLMEHTREVSTPIFNFAEIVLPIMFDKKKDELGVLFKFLNQLLVYGTIQMRNTPRALDPVNICYIKLFSYIFRKLIK